MINRNGNIDRANFLVRRLDIPVELLEGQRGLLTFPSHILYTLSPPYPVLPLLKGGMSIVQSLVISKTIERL